MGDLKAKGVLSLGEAPSTSRRRGSCAASAARRSSSGCGQSSRQPNRQPSDFGRHEGPDSEIRPFACCDLVGNLVIFDCITTSVDYPPMADLTT